MVWRNLINYEIKPHLESSIRQTKKNSKAYKNAKNPGNAQLWIAIANLSKQITELNLKIEKLTSKSTQIDEELIDSLDQF